MNRRERRAATARRNPGGNVPLPDVAALTAEATRAFRAGQFLQADAICCRILAQIPAHAPSLNLLGLINQASGHHGPAIKMFAKAIAANEDDAACHYNIGMSYQNIDEKIDAVAHFRKAIALGLKGKDVGDLLLQNPAIVEGVKRAAAHAAAPVGNLFGEHEMASFAKNIFLRCALQASPICNVLIEFFLSHLRLALLDRANTAVHAPLTSDDTVELFCALAQQCFISEYVLAQTDEETRQANRLRDQLLQMLPAQSTFSPILLAGVAAYLPLHSLPDAESLLALSWPKCVDDLLQQQVREPLAEAKERRTIPALTDIEPSSIAVMRQYEENPYPPWVADPPANPRAAAGSRFRHGGRNAENAAPSHRREILIAGCGTGYHAFIVARQSPDARVLAVDLSLASLGYARRRTLEAGLRNIEYAQADLLKLATIGRTFDHIEAMGVLHHLADPEAGWRALLSLLRPDGTMRVGLYSNAARRLIVDARALIAERGYPATVAGIRALRRAIIFHPDKERWKHLLATSADFYNTSGCRDLFFNVIEHRFTIPQIADFLDKQGLSFLGFQLEPAVFERFQRQYPSDQALARLDCWHAFEMANPDTFSRMYVFSVRKKTDSSLEADHDRATARL